MSRTEYADTTRGGTPFPTRWGIPPRDPHTRSLWIFGNARLEQRTAGPGRDAAKRLLQLHLRRLSP